MPKRILFVTYGAGHVNMVIPVARRLLERGDVVVDVLGLTTAGPALEAAGIPYFGFRHVITPDDNRAREVGNELARAHHTGPVSREETIAYLGLSYADLEQRVGAQEAATRYAQEGRQAFLPVAVLERVLRDRRPDLVVATSSPRAERAAIEAARNTGLPAICMVDLFALLEVKWIGRPGYADRICVLSEYTKQVLLQAGRREDEVVITGNPAFDRLADPELDYRAEQLRRARGWNSDPVILWASGREPERHPLTGQTGDPTLPRRVDRELFNILARRDNWNLVIRPHPSETLTWEGLPKRVWISDRTDHLPALLKAIDVVVTASSTVGLEAALLGRPVVALQEAVTARDSPYVEMGIAVGVPTVAGLEQGLSAVLDNGWNPRARMPAPGTATDNVIGVIDQLV